MRPTLLVLILIFGVMKAQAQAPSKSDTTKTQFSAQGFGFAFECSGDYFQSTCQSKVEPRLTTQENGNQLHFGIGPKRIKFSLSLKPPKFILNQKEWREREAWIVFVPIQDSTVPDFNKAYPELEASVTGLRSILNSGKVKSIACENLLVWDFLDAMQMIHSKAKFLKTPWCNGVQYLTQEVQEACEIDSSRLVYRFIGLSNDGKYLVDMFMPVAHPSLPIPAPGIESAEQPKVVAYCTKAESQINRLNDQTFYPTLTSLESLVSTIRSKP